MQQTHTHTYSLQAPQSRQHFLAAAAVRCAASAARCAASAAAMKVLLANFTKFWPKCKVCKQCVMHMRTRRP